MVFLHSKAAHDEWEPYENSGLSGNFVRLRHNVWPILLTKRRFFLPRVNLVGLSLIELAIAMALSSALGGMGYVQRDDIRSSSSLAQIPWVPMLAVVTFRAGVNLLFGISYERSMFWHGYFALLALAYGAWHGYVALFRRRFRFPSTPVSVLRRRSVPNTILRHRDNRAHQPGLDHLLIPRSDSSLCAAPVDALASCARSDRGRSGSDTRRRWCDSCWLWHHRARPILRLCTCVPPVCGRCVDLSSGYSLGQSPPSFVS
jgi:hypothetical protein